VVAIDQKGFRVSDISEAELRDITSARQSLEQLALADAIASDDAQWEGEVLAAYHRLKRIALSVDGSDTVINPEWEQAHDAFHAALVSGCRSEWIKKFCGILREQTARYRSISVGVGHAHARDVDAEHAAIVDAVLKHDVDAASNLLQEHFAATTQLVVELLAQMAAATKRAAAKP
jgi:GntR family carbon starvation induced transcriptional regulator